MTIKYKVQEEDFLTHQLFVASQSEKIRKKRFRGKLFLSIVYLLFGFFQMYEGNSTMATVFFVLAIGWFFLYPLWEKGYYKKNYQKAVRAHYWEQFDKTTTLEITPHYLKASDEGAESKIEINELAIINEIPTLILIEVKSGQSLVVPKYNVQNLEAFKSELKQIASKNNLEYNFYENWVWK